MKYPLVVIERSPSSHGKGYVDCVPTCIFFGGITSSFSICSLQAATFPIHCARPSDVNISMPSSPWHITIDSSKSVLHCSISGRDSPVLSVHIGFQALFHIGLPSKCLNPT